MDSARRLENLTYYGKTTCCHSQALLTAFFPKRLMPDLWLFESYTTVPFGITHISGDPNRLIDCYLDPDFGLDRALEALGVSYEVRFWQAGSDGIEATQTLRSWCVDGPVVVGPLNMDGLLYHFHSELFHGMDHYAVVIGITGNKVWLSDTEGFALALLTIEEMLDAWRGDRIPEGRGEFIMRRVLNDTRQCEGHHALRRTMQLAADNFAAAREADSGGSKALRILADQAPVIEDDPSLRRGLTYVIPTRIQRCVFARHFLHAALAIPGINRLTGGWIEAIEALNGQILMYGEVLADLMDRVPGALVRLSRVAELEEKLAVLFESMGGGL